MGNRKSKKAKFVIRRNAGKHRCREVYCSYGTMLQILPFLSDVDLLMMQRCGKFCYDIAVSRVQVKFCFPFKHYFIQNLLQTERHSIFRVNSSLIFAERIVDKRLDFNNCLCSVLLGNELYCYYRDGAFTKI